MIFIPLRAAERRFTEAEATVLYVRAKPGERDAARVELEAILRRLRRLAPDEPERLRALHRRPDHRHPRPGERGHRPRHVRPRRGQPRDRRHRDRERHDHRGHREDARDRRPARARGAPALEVLRQFLLEAAFLSGTGGLAGVLVASLLGRLITALRARLLRRGPGLGRPHRPRGVGAHRHRGRLPARPPGGLPRPRRGAPLRVRAEVDRRMAASRSGVPKTTSRSPAANRSAASGTSVPAAPRRTSSNASANRSRKRDSSKVQPTSAAGSGTSSTRESTPPAGSKAPARRVPPPRCTSSSAYTDRMSRFEIVPTQAARLAVGQDRQPLALLLREALQHARQALLGRRGLEARARDVSRAATDSGARGAAQRLVDVVQVRRPGEAPVRIDQVEVVAPRGDEGVRAARAAAGRGRRPRGRAARGRRRAARRSAPRPCRSPPPCGAAPPCTRRPR